MDQPAATSVVEDPVAEAFGDVGRSLTQALWAAEALARMRVQRAATDETRAVDDPATPTVDERTDRLEDAAHHRDGAEHARAGWQALAASYTTPPTPRRAATAAPGGSGGAVQRVSVATRRGSRFPSRARPARPANPGRAAATPPRAPRR